MVHFNGKYTCSAKKHFNGMYLKFSLVMMILSISLTIPIVIVVSHIFNSSLAFCLFLILSILLNMTMWGAIAIHLVKNQRVFNVTIERDGTLFWTEVGISKDAEKIDISSIYCIMDRGDFYDVQINPFHNSAVLCQKDLLIEGTLEEFEEIYKDKIVRKTQD